MSAQQFLKMQRAGQVGGETKDRRRVQGTKRTQTSDGLWHDSGSEAKRWEQLLLLQRDGAICGLRRQVDIPLWGRDGPIMTDKGTKQRVCRADFIYVDNALGCTVIEDRKGHITEKSALVLSILQAQSMRVLITHSGKPSEALLKTNFDRQKT
ncbi:hypothetical protein [Epibacterium ulvae]|uniref:hypothetical protein n=1 Tax=Epibacterium ulvae TaxID=1156985 RepID=UPI0024927317|nr:hypothetical protein [Epibacterium ulvae]